MSKTPYLTIGVLAKRTGCKVETIRYYERIGLIEEPLRSAGGHRHYAEAHLKRLNFVRRARDLGFPLETVRALLALATPGDRTCAEVERLATTHLETVRAKLADLRRLKKVLDDLVARCKGGTVPECPIIEALFESAGLAAPGAGRRPAPR